MFILFPLFPAPFQMGPNQQMLYRQQSQPQPQQQYRPTPYGLSPAQQQYQQHQHQRPPLPSPMMYQQQQQPRMAPPPSKQYMQQQQQYQQRPAWDDEASESSGTYNEDTPEGRAGPAGPQRGRPSPSANPNVPARSYAKLGEDKGVRTNLGNTAFVMGLLSEMWLLNLVFYFLFY